MSGPIPIETWLVFSSAVLGLTALPFNAAYGASGGRLRRLIVRNARLLAMRLALARPRN